MCRIENVFCCVVKVCVKANYVGMMKRGIFFFFLRDEEGYCWDENNPNAANIYEVVSSFLIL